VFCGGTEDDDDKNLQFAPNSPLKVSDYVCFTIGSIVVLTLLSFIIYISVTWNKDRTNEYT
jgi:hypothetical protein